MNQMKQTILFALVLTALPPLFAREPNLEEAKVSAYALESPLVFEDGTPLKERAEWPKRRAEIVRIFEREMYGRTPSAPETVALEKIEEGDTFAGLGVRRQYRMRFRKDGTGPAVDWLVVTPKYAKGPLPFYMMLNYKGNQELLDDPGVVETHGTFNKISKPGSRGKMRRSGERSGVDVGQLLARGYAFVTACYAEVAGDPLCPQEPEALAYNGVFDLWPKRDETATSEPTALGAWAWALSRGLDLAEQLPFLDARRSVVTGSSRLGKAALLAASRDERFAVAVINQTGGGGVPLAKRDFGENVSTEMRMFPHWFCKAYGKYVDNEGAMKFDQHLLVASIAPRPILVQGYDRAWFDPKGEYLSCRAASAAWEFLGLPGLPQGDFPDDFDTSRIGSHLGYVRRSGLHGFSPYDWKWSLDFADAALKRVAPARDVAQWADPMVGTAGTGHCSPAAAYPFGMVQPGADTGRAGWDYCAGYHYQDAKIVGFSQTHLNGTGSTDLGDVSVFPFTGVCPAKLESRFSHERETAEPGYYAVTLDDFGIRAEATCSERVAYYRFSSAGPLALALDYASTMNGGANDPQTRTVAAEMKAEGKRLVTGTVSKKGWIERQLYFAIETDRDVRVEDGNWKMENGETGRVLMPLDGDQELLVRIAISARSVEGAKRNLASDGGSWDFAGFRCAARAAWNRHLDRIDVPAGTDEAARRNLYTALYRLGLQPNLLSDVGEKPFYTTFSLWDTFRAAHPLYAELYPERVPAFVDSLLEQGRRTGHLPVWPLWGKETDWMIGTHSIPVIVDWFLRESKNEKVKVKKCGRVQFWEGAYAQIRDTLTERHGRTKVDWGLLDKYGYYPYDLVKGEGVSRLLEGSFDDWCAGKMAERLGKREDAAYFFRRANAWTNVFDRSVGFMRGRRTDGGWREPFDPREVGHNVDTANDFTEGNAYQWTWHVLQDPAGLIDALGGKAAAEKRLDALFAADSTLTGTGCKDDVTGMIGQYAHGNEPSHHIPWLYALCGRPDKAQAVVERIMREFYRPAPDGLAGNDDCGQMSAWYVWAFLGRYPVTPCGGATVDFSRCVVSPDGHNEIRFYERPLAYAVLRDGMTVVEKTPIGLTVDGTPLAADGKRPKFVRRTLSGMEATAVYKKSEIDLAANELFADYGDWGVRLVARNDGVAYRFETKRPGRIRVNGEQASLAIPDRNATCFAYRTNSLGQEEAVPERFAAGALTTDPSGPKNWLGKGVVYLPFAYSVGGKCVAVTESDVRDYPIWNLTRPVEAAAQERGTAARFASRFAGWPKATAQERGTAARFASRFAGWPKATARWTSWHGRDGTVPAGGRKIVVTEHEDYLTDTDGTRTFPWRAFVLADSFAKFCESDLVRALAAPAEAKADFSWVRPGKVAWDWWNAFDNQGDEGCNTKTYERFIDFAAKHGVEYVILDEGWSETLNIWKFHPNVDVPHLIGYANKKGVGIILWMAWAQVAGDEERVAAHFAKLGAKGFKVDFMDRGDAEVARFLWKFADACARNRMMVDYHGVHRPVGMERAYPNVVNYEGVHGLEQMKWFEQTEEAMMFNDVCAFFVRLTAGPMDYTPGAMLNHPLDGSYKGGDNFPGSVGTRCRQMAQLVLYEAPLQMLCDSPTNYETNGECLKFLAAVPTTWRKTAALGGTPETYAAAARQAKDGSWYAAAISNKDARAISVDTAFLGEGAWTMEVFRDAQDAASKPTHYVHETKSVKAGEKLTVALAPGGGFVAKFVQNNLVK